MRWQHMENLPVIGNEKAHSASYDLDNNLLNSASLLSTMRELILGNITPVKAVNMPIKILYNFVAVV